MILKKDRINGKKCKTKKLKELEAYTFIETIAVLAICTVLTAGGSVSAAKIISLAKKTSAKNQIEQFSSALQCYFLDCGRFPTTEQGLGALWEKPTMYPVPENWNGPYLDRESYKDPWGTNFIYICSGHPSMPSEVHKKLPFVLISYGADGKEGGEKNDADIVSWK